MVPDSNLYLHEADKAALSALKAIPGFGQAMKAFMKVWNEKQFKLINMSTNLRLGDRQLKKYYDMLPPICEKLGIDVPELYVELDVRPNAYTYGDTNPFIVMTSGLFDTIPDELIPTVLAHECGHIACHHTLYSSLGRIIMNGSISFLGLGTLAIIPLQIAFAYWQRCSEFSADRAAIICDGGPEKTVEMCMRFAGCDKDISGEYDVEEFIEQAKEYKQMVSDSAFNKTLEFLMFNQNNHPLNAVRAYEAREWASGGTFKTIMDLMGSPSLEDSGVGKIDPRDFIGKKIDAVIEELTKKGFSNIESVGVKENLYKEYAGAVTFVSIDGNSMAGEDYYNKDVHIVIRYFEG